MRIAFALALLAACGSSTPPATERPVSVPPSDAAVAERAADAPPDAGPSEALSSAPAWVFRFSSPDRTETWTLRTAGTEAMLDVQSATGSVRYLGTATDAEALAVRVASPTAKMTLDCKKAKRAVGTKCNDAKAKKLDVLDCYHPDFKEPMPFGPAPGVEYAAQPDCKGYRLIKP